MQGLPKMDVSQATELTKVVDEKGEFLTWQTSEFVENVLNTLPGNNQFFSLQQIKSRLEIQNAFDNAKDKPATILTNEQFAELEETIQQRRWEILEPAFVEFQEMILAAKDFDPNKELTERKLKTPKT